MIVDKENVALVFMFLLSLQANYLFVQILLVIYLGYC
jgi:hypothetical protein